MRPAPAGTVKIDHSRSDGVVVVVLCEEHDLATVPVVEQALVEANQPRPVRVVADLTLATFVDSSILRTLIAGKARSLAFAIAAPREGEPRRVLDLSGVSRVLNVADTVEEAAETF
jgi:anti-anti-sigma factor